MVIESTIYPIPMTLIFAFMLGSQFERKEASILIFFVGLAFDLFSFRPAGVDSLIFLLMISFLSYFRQKIHAGRAIYRLGLLVLSCLIYSLIFYKLISVSYLILTIFAVLMIFIFMERYFPVNLKNNRLSL